MKSSFAGLGPLLAATLRYEGRKFAPWIAIATLLSVSSVVLYPLLFSTAHEREGFATTVGGNPALGLIFGPAHDLLTADGFNSWRSLALGGFLTAIGAIFAVTRAVREQEDSGQAELLASGVLGRSARLGAGVALSLIGSLAVGLISGVLTVLCGGGFEDSILLCLTFTATGWMFTGVAAVASQVASESRTANTLAIGLLGVLFIVRGFLYSVLAPSWTSWVNPLSWMTETAPASQNNWLPLVYAVALALVLIAVSFKLQYGRDFGQGLIAPSPGKPYGELSSPFGLALRSNSGPLVTWFVAALGLGLLFGYFAGSIKDMLGTNPAIAHVFASGQADPHDMISAIAVTILSLAGIILSISGVQIMLNVRTEEQSDRLEPAIVAGGSRARHYGSYIALALLSTAVFLGVSGALMGVVAQTRDVGLTFSDVFVQALCAIPAVWAVIGVSVAVVGARPAVSLAAWAGVFLSFALTLLGPTFKLWNWALAISPFYHVPNVNASSTHWVGICVVLLIACVLCAVGLRGFITRDLAR